jgi:hypothetical protein
LRRGLAELSSLVAGALVLLVPVLIYFASANALPELIDSVVRFNSVYVQATFKARLDAVLEGLRLLAPTGLPLFSVSVWIMAALGLGLNRGESSEVPLVRLAIIGLPVEFSLVALSGRSINHYFMAWLPICAVLSARFFQQVIEAPEGGRSKSSAGIDRRFAWAVGLSAVMLLLPLRRLLPPSIYLLNHGARDAFARGADLAQYDEQYLLMWGAETTFNFLAGKPSPTRYVFQYPLYACDYVSDEMVEEFRGDVVSKRPVIVDSSPGNPGVPPIDPEQRRGWSEGTENCALTDPMLKLLSYINANYQIAGRMSYTDWPIYRHVD